MDGGQSDSGRGCSDEDLSAQCGGGANSGVCGHHPGAPFGSHSLSRNGVFCKSCTTQGSTLETFHPALSLAEEVNEVSTRRYTTSSPIHSHTLPHKHLDSNEAPYDAIHTTTFSNGVGAGDDKEQQQRTPATLRRLRGALVTPPPVTSSSGSGATAAQTPQRPQTDVKHFCKDHDTILFKDMALSKN